MKGRRFKQASVISAQTRRKSIKKLMACESDLIIFLRIEKFSFRFPNGAVISFIMFPYSFKNSGRKIIDLNIPLPCIVCQIPDLVPLLL